MFTGVVGYDVCHSLLKSEAASVAQFAEKLAVQTMNNVTQPAPVVGSIAFAVSDQPDSKAGEFNCLPRGRSGFAFVLGLTNSVPIDRGEWNVSHLTLRQLPEVQPRDRIGRP